MALFKKQPQQSNVSPRQALQMKYNSARGNLLLVILFTAVNVLLLVANTGSYFLFSAFIPYMLVDEGMFYTGRYPAEIYEEYFPDMAFLGDNLFYALICVSITILALYFLCWLFSKNNRAGWIVTALVFFSLDTAGYLLYGLLYGMLDVSSIIDVLFHVWVLYYLINGLVANAKLKKLPAEEEAPAEATEASVTTEDNDINE